MGRLRQTNVQIASIGQYTNVPVHHLSVRRLEKRPNLVDTVLDEKTKKSVIDGSLNSLGLAFDAFKWRKRQIYGYVVGVFLKLELLEILAITEEEFLNFVIDIDRGYFDNPYHNFYHAVDVFHIVYYFLEFVGGRKWMAKLDILAILIGALCHDIAHPGVNNLYQVHARTKLAIMYNDISVIENYSCAMTFNLAAKHGLFRNLNRADYRSLRATIIQGLLATDMSCHFELLEKFKTFIKGFNVEEQQPTVDQKRLILNVILHAGDISNPCRPWELCKKWSDMVVEEFFLQGDLEKLNGLPLSPNMDRDVHNQPSISTGFIDFLVKPFFEAISCVLPETSRFLDQMAENRAIWQELKEDLEKKAKDGVPTSSMEVLPSGQRRLSVPPGTVTLPEELFLHSVESDRSPRDSSHSHIKSKSQTSLFGSRTDLSPVIENGDLFSSPGDDGYSFLVPSRDAQRNLKAKTSIHRPKKSRPAETDKEYFGNLLEKTLHLNSEDITAMQAKKSSKGPNRTLAKATALLELSSLIIEIEKMVGLNGDAEDPLLTLLFINIAELIGRVETSSHCRLFLVDQKKVGGIVLFSRGGFDHKGDTGDAPMSVEGSNTPFAEVVRQGQVITSYVPPVYGLLFPMIADSPPALQGSTIGVIDLRRTTRAYDNDDIKLLDVLSQLITPKLLMAYQAEEEKKRYPSSSS